MTDVMYADVVVDLGNLRGPEGNALAILGNVQGAMRRAGRSKAEIDAYLNEATSGDYAHLLCTTMETVTVVKRGHAPLEIVDSLEDLLGEDDSDWTDD